MRYLLIMCLAMVLVVGLGKWGRAQEYSSVPTAIEQIGDSLFRDALAQYAPNYNALPRDAQIAAYANMYRVIHNGQQPALSANEAALLNQHQARQYRRPEPQLRTEFPIWDQPPVLMQEGSPSLLHGPWGHPAVRGWEHNYGWR